MRCFEGKSSLPALLVDKVKFHVASLVCTSLRDISMFMILNRWKEVAFSNSCSHFILEKWSPSLEGFCKLNLMEVCKGI